MSKRKFCFIPLLILFVFWGYVPLFAQAPRFTCEEAGDWNALLDRDEGWLAGDGIFTFGLEGDSRQGSATDSSQTVFLFSDSFIGEANPDHTFKPGIRMINHCVALLEGNKPDQPKMRFFYNRDDKNNPANLFDRHFWLGDGIVIDAQLYTTGTVVDPKTWDLEGPWMIRVPIQNNRPDFSQYETKRVELFHKNGDFEVLFGIGITDCGEDVYIYGFRDKKGTPFYPRQLVVAKAPRQSFFQTETWTFWTGERWSKSIADCNCDQAALAEAMSNELSVTRMTGGPYEGKFVLVYTHFCILPELRFALAEAPNARFSEPATFYTCPEPKRHEEEIKELYGQKASVVTYNAKAHPRLSQPGELLVSYNVNVFGPEEGKFFTEKTYLFPRFVRLRFLEKE